MIRMGYFFIISQLGDSNDHHQLNFYENRQLCVLVIINIHTFSCLLISWVFIMFIHVYEIYGILYAKSSYREII